MSHYLQVDDTVFVGTSPTTIGRITGFKTDITNGQRIAFVVAGPGESLAEQLHIIPVHDLKRAPNFIFASGSIDALGKFGESCRRFYTITQSRSNHGR